MSALDKMKELAEFAKENPAARVLGQFGRKKNKTHEKMKQQIKDYEKVLRYYSQMTAVCEHDDPSWCEFCPDAGRRATKVLKKYDKGDLNESRRS